MLADRYGLALSTRSDAARDAYVAGADCLLSGGAGAEDHFLRALAADPQFALAQVALGRTLFVHARVPQAREAAARARELAGRTTAREQDHVHALALAIEGHAAESLAATRTHLATHPRDAMVLAPATGVFGLIGFSGRPEREAEQYELLAGLARHYGDDWWFLSMLAFAAEESGRLGEAGELIERSMAANPRNAHGAHIKAHVLYERGEDAEGLAYLAGWMPDFPKQGQMHCHLSWHVALFALRLGQTERAWRTYLEDVHPGAAWGPPLNVVTDSASFLWRSELAGEARRAALWGAVHRHALDSFPRAGVTFADVHVALACVASGDASGLARLVSELRERESAGKLPSGSVAPRLAEAFGACGRGDWAQAAQLLEGAREETVRIGGSRAQRDLVEHTLLAACLRAGRPDEATRLAARPEARGARAAVRGLP